MKKSTKGALAAAAASAVLLGGAGSLAYWNATTTLAGGGVQSGELKLSTPVCGDWKLDGGEVTGGATFIPGTTLLVPGDVIKRSCKSTITATGEHLRAEVTAPAPTTSPDSTGFATINASYNIAPAGPIGAPAASQSVITEADNGKVITSTVTFTVLNPNAVDNSSQGGVATLSDYVVTLKQVHN